ncbi:hypothetical protein C4B63_66g64 [Trypanosoma cruzi]|uniref:Uncharacterized protein n=1 Tax=Trypanosoma cruzi TaxID=5693 RepID=A0A2V2UXU1_TRYCR|nr:hypothetical protein C4B63_66g64 [Trypanosoma cruzi]
MRLRNVLSAHCRIILFLAMQEPQGHRNCVQHKLISAVDPIFLRCRRRDPVIVYLVQCCGVLPVQPLDVRLAFALVALCFRENKFNLFHVENGGDTAMSNSAEYYGLVEEESGDGGGIGGSSRRVSSPLGWRRVEQKQHRSCQRQFNALCGRWKVRQTCLLPALLV